MDAKKMLMSVATAAVGWIVGLYVYKSFMSGARATSSGASSATTPSAAEQAAKSFSYSGMDY